MQPFALAALVALSASAAVLPPSDPIRQAIRTDDLPSLTRLVQSPGAAGQPDRLGATPLHYAAIYGSLEALKILLAAHADPNRTDQAGATPLIYAAWNLDRTRLLVTHGASVNVASRNGTTPLLVAAAAHENLSTIRFLLDHGADIQARNQFGQDALLRATAFGDPEMVQLLLERGADPKRRDLAGFTALQLATTYPGAARVRLLLDAGSDVNSSNTFAGTVKNGPIALTHMTPLMTAAPFSDGETIRILLTAGARVNEKDSRGMTPLMLAIATDHAKPATVRQLLAAGADVQPKDIYGDSALAWARRYNGPEITALLLAAGAKDEKSTAEPVSAALLGNSNPGESISRTLALFSKSDFFRQGGGCAGCHHQPAYARAYAAVSNAQLPADPFLRQSFLNSVTAVRPRLAGEMPFLNTFGGDFDVPLSLIVTQADLKLPADENTDLTLHFLANRQDPSGAWIAGGISRSPLEESSISRTAGAIHALQTYAWPARAAEFRARVAKARQWLLQAVPETTYEHADRIVGLRQAGMAASGLRADAEHLLALQREDGGWAQTRFLSSDAYATGLVLDSLFRSGLLTPEDPAYRRGVTFLLRTQCPDGSWYVRSRAPKFQPYFQSGFPFDHDQWISSIGSSWAVIALSHAATPAPSTMAHR